jgi:hypothetical protein
MHDILVVLCQPAMVPRVYSGELQRGIKYVQDMYFTLVSEIKGIVFAGVLMDSTERFMVLLSSQRMRRGSRLCRPAL